MDHPLCSGACRLLGPLTLSPLKLGRGGLLRQWADYHSGLVSSLQPSLELSAVLSVGVSAGKLD